MAVLTTTINYIVTIFTNALIHKWKSIYLCCNFCAAASAFSFASIWNSWKRCEIRWLAFRNFSKQFKAQDSYTKISITTPNKIFSFQLFTSVLLTFRLVKSFTQSTKHSSLSLLYEMRKSLNWKRVFWGYVDGKFANAYRAYLIRVQIVGSCSGWQWYTHFCVGFSGNFNPTN